MNELVSSLGVVLIISIFLEMGVVILYFNEINSYPPKKCIYPKRSIRAKVFGYTLRNTVKGVPKEVFVLNLYQLISGIVVVIILVYFYSNSMECSPKLIQVYCIITLMFLLICAMGFLRTIWIYKYKRFTLKNCIYLLLPFKRNIKKEYIGEAQIIDIHKIGRRKYATVVCNNKRYKNVLVESESPPCLLYQLLGVFWIEEKETMDYVFIEDIIGLMLEEKEDYKYFLRISDLKVISVFDEYAQAIESSDNYILIPNLLTREYDYEEGDLMFFISNKDMEIAERWCRSHNISYCYKVMSPSMLLH